MPTHTPIAPTRPVAPYLGGKRNLAKRLVERIDAVPHTLYAEPFIGMGGVFLRRINMPRAEVINDLNREIATLFRVLQVHYMPFVEMLKYQLPTRADFERLRKTDPETLTDLSRAARFLYIQRLAFGGNPRGVFGVSPGRPARFDVTKLGAMLEDLHSRLAGVTIECLPYQEFIRRYDRPGTLFYLDPPYYGNENDYGKDMFSRDDFETLRALLAGLKGRFIMSLNDRPEVRETFTEFDMEAIKTTYSVAKKDSKRAGELIISG